MKRLTLILVTLLLGALTAMASCGACATKPKSAAKPAAKPAVATVPAAPQKPLLVGLYYFPKNSPGFEGLNDAQIADKLVGMGINAIWGNEGDAGFVDAMHARGIKVFYTQPMGYGWGDNDTNRPVLENGQKLDTYAPGHWYQGACPNDEARIQRELDAISKVLTTTKADGVWLDSIRFPIYWETTQPKLEQGCFCDRCLDQFQHDTHIPIPADVTDARSKAQWIVDTHERDWTEWKMMRITNKVKRVQQVVKAANPNALLGAFTVPWRHEDYNNAIEKIVSQDYPKLAKHLDVISPMVYHRMCGQEENVQWINDIVTYVKQETGGTVPVVPIIQSIEENAAWNKYVMTSEEFAKATASAMKAPSSGVIVLTGIDLFSHKYEKAFEVEVKKGLR